MLKNFIVSRPSLLHIFSFPTIFFFVLTFILPKVFYICWFFQEADSGSLLFLIWIIFILLFSLNIIFHGLLCFKYSDFFSSLEFILTFSSYSQSKGLKYSFNIFLAFVNRGAFYF